MTAWSLQQNEALSKAGAWLRLRHAPTFYLSGYAGTGKTTLAMHMAQHAEGKVAFAAFTGKAARVMRSKGCVGAQTIHSLIYISETDEETGEVTVYPKPRSELEKYELIVIDECSMVDEVLGRDLLAYGVPVLVLGDPAQLPPISGGGYFTSGRPDYLLTDVHRQAADSPIIHLATDIREGRANLSSIVTDGLTITDRNALDPRAVTEADIILVGRNDTRQRYNRRMREILGRPDQFPVKGEPLICLRNDKSKRIFNGDILTVARTKQGRKSVKLWMDDPEGERKTQMVDVRKEFFDDDVAASKLSYRDTRGTQHFTYGYAITCHKAQGSQWGNVCVFNESSAFRQDSARWLYTAVTRAAEHLTLVI